VQAREERQRRAEQPYPAVAHLIPAVCVCARARVRACMCRIGVVGGTRLELRLGCEARMEAAADTTRMGGLTGAGPALPRLRACVTPWREGGERLKARRLGWEGWSAAGVKEMKGRQRCGGRVEAGCMHAAGTRKATRMGRSDSDGKERLGQERATRTGFLLLSPASHLTSREPHWYRAALSAT
jgi:hypothetical protein